MFRFALCAIVLLAACAKDPNPCATGCISTFVEWEEGFGPSAAQQRSLCLADRRASVAFSKGAWWIWQVCGRVPGGFALIDAMAHEAVAQIIGNTSIFAQQAFLGQP